MPLVGLTSEFMVWAPQKTKQNPTTTASYCSWGLWGENKVSPLTVASSVALGFRNCNVCTLTSPFRLYLPLPGGESHLSLKGNSITSPVNKIRPREKFPTSLGLCACVFIRVCVCVAEVYKRWNRENLRWYTSAQNLIVLRKVQISS